MIHSLLPRYLHYGARRPNLFADRNMINYVTKIVSEQKESVQNITC